METQRGADQNANQRRAQDILNQVIDEARHEIAERNAEAMGTLVNRVRRLASRMDHELNQLRHENERLREELGIGTSRLASIEDIGNIEIVGATCSTKSQKPASPEVPSPKEPFPHLPETPSVVTSGDKRSLDADMSATGEKAALCEAATSSGSVVAPKPAPGQHEQEAENGKVAKVSKLDEVEESEAQAGTRRILIQAHQVWAEDDDPDPPIPETEGIISNADEDMMVEDDDPLLLEEKLQELEMGERGCRAVFADAVAMKEKVRQNLMKPVFKVSDYYWTTGYAQWIARHTLFDQITLMVIAANAVWIAIDTDYNKASTIAEADLVFQVAENVFCTYFTWEWVVRVAAFRRKRDCLNDAWLIFDTILLIVMVLETWVMTAFNLLSGPSPHATAGGGEGDRQGGDSGSISLNTLKMVRLVRLTRMARVAKLLKAVPELVVLLKGIAVAARSVFFTLCLLFLFIYVFAVGLTQLTAETEVAERYFKTVPDAMTALLLYGTLPDLAEMVFFVGREKFYFAIVLCAFILLATLTVMNMLVGVLVEVVGVVSAVEKEALVLTHVKCKMISLMKASGLIKEDDPRPETSVVSKEDFMILMGKPEAARILQCVGVDAVSLVDFADFIFKDTTEVTFVHFMEFVLQLRGSNTATVKDIVDMRKVLLKELHDLETSIVSKLSPVVKQVALQSRRSTCQPGLGRSMTRGLAARSTVTNSGRTSVHPVARGLEATGTEQAAIEDVSAAPVAAPSAAIAAGVAPAPCIVPAKASTCDDDQDNSFTGIPKVRVTGGELVNVAPCGIPSGSAEDEANSADRKCDGGADTSANPLLRAHGWPVFPSSRRSPEPAGGRGAGLAQALATARQSLAPLRL